MLLTGITSVILTIVAPLISAPLLALLQTPPELMAEAPIGFKLHALVAFGLFALWPFTRLVHVFSAPLGYLTRPYIVYRSREESRAGARRERRGWEKVG